MITKMLLRLYPAAWRKEFGVELSDLLCSRPLTLRIAADVLRSALRQRLRQTPPWLMSGALQFLFFVAYLVLQVRGLVSPAARMALIIPIAMVLQFGTGVWIAASRTGSVLSATAGTIASTLVGYLPLQIAVLLTVPPADFPYRTLLVQMRLLNAGRVFVYVVAWSALLGCFGAICGTFVRRRKGHPA